MKCLIIAEKPELAKAIAEALEGNVTNKNGYKIVEKNQDTYLVSWCFGHLLTLKEPSDYNKEYERWNLDNLPFKVQNYAYKPIGTSQNKQIKLIGELLETVDTVIHAGDPDDEGQYLVDIVLNYLKNNKPVKRVLINDNTKASVQKALANLKDNKDFIGYSNSAKVRSIGDWVYGLNLTRTISLKAREIANGFVPTLSIGRVQTPILNLVYIREKEVENHVKELFYNLVTNNNFKYEIPKEKLDNKLCKDKDYILDIQSKCNSDNDFIIENIEVKNIETPPPLTFNLLELQAEASKRFKYSPDKTQEITQVLREKYKAITYNRSDCQYLTEEHYNDREQILTTIKHNLKEYNDVNIDINLKSKAFNTNNVSAHHAIIPTNTAFDIFILNQDILNIYKLIAERYLLQFLPNKVVEKTIYTAKNTTGLIFKAISNKTLNNGWTDFYKEDTNEDTENNTYTYNYNKGDKADFKEFKVIEGETKPKQLYTFGTLLKELTNVSKYVKDDKLKDSLKEKDKDKKGENGGIGTPATRAEILKKLIEKKYIVEEKGKLKTTPLAKSFLEALPDVAKTPEITALWAIKQALIKDSKLSVEEFIKEIEDFVDTKVQEIKTGVIKLGKIYTGGDYETKQNNKSSNLKTKSKSSKTNSKTFKPYKKN